MLSSTEEGEEPRLTAAATLSAQSAGFPPRRNRATAMERSILFPRLTLPERAEGQRERGGGREGGKGQLEFVLFLSPLQLPTKLWTYLYRFQRRRP